jgi:hypothetical protein
VIEHAVLIAAADLLPTMRACLAGECRELLGFTDAEALRALEVITTRRPGLVLLERRFAHTPRGAALINRVKADPSLADTEIRVVTPDGHPVPEPAAPVAPSPPEPSPAPTAPPPLDYKGTRRAARHRIAGPREILVDGNRGSLVDLSTFGAQVLMASVLKPNQRVRLSLSDDQQAIRCVATVVWASFEIPKGSSPRYRVGLDFTAPDAAALDAYIERHGER